MGLFKKNTQQNMKILGTYNLEHILGLNIPENISCNVELYLDKLLIKLSGSIYTLDVDKIIGCDFKMDIDVKQYIKSNVAKGLVGSLAFGLPGAVAFSSPKIKEKKEIKGYAIINYQNNNNEYTYLILRDIYANSSNASRLVDKLRPLIKNRDIKETNL